jgi:uncharacterized protein YggE
MSGKTLAAMAMTAGVLMLPSLAPAQAMREGTMRVIGRGVIEVAPDYAVVRVGIANRASAPTAALDQNSAIARKIIAFAKRFGIDERDIATETVNLTPIYRQGRNADGGRQELDGYAATNMVRAKLAEVARLGPFMRQVLDEGATNIDGVAFGVSDTERHADEALVKAVEDAVRQAERLAQAAKVRLGPIREILHPPRTGAPIVESPMDRRVMARRGAPVPIEAGTIRVTAEVEIVWAIE